MAGENIAAPTLDELFREEPFVADIGPRNALNFPGWGDLVRVEKPLRSDLNTVLKDAREPPSKQRSSVYFEDFKKFSEAWVSHDLGFKWERLFVVLEKDTFGLWSSRREWENDASVRDKICFSFATTSTLLTAEAWEQGFPETDLITIITPDECLTLRFDTKLEHMEWVETLGKLWQAKYSQEELKAKNKLRQEFSGIMSQYRALCVDKYLLLSRYSFKFGAPPVLQRGPIDLIREERNVKQLFAELYPFVIVFYPYEDEAFSHHGMDGRRQPQKYAYLPLRFVSASIPDPSKPQLLLITPDKEFWLDCRTNDYRDLWYRGIGLCCEKGGHVNEPDLRVVPPVDSRYNYSAPLQKTFALRYESKSYRLISKHGMDYIGRAANNDIIINDGRVGKWHARIDVVNNVPWLVDLGSKNGTLLNGVSITIAPLKPGDLITLGSTELKVEAKGVQFYIGSQLSDADLFRTANLFCRFCEIALLANLTDVDLNVEDLSRDQLIDLVHGLRMKFKMKSSKKTRRLIATLAAKSSQSSLTSASSSTFSSSNALSSIDSEQEGYKSVSISDRSSDQSTDETTEFDSLRESDNNVDLASLFGRRTPLTTPPKNRGYEGSLPSSSTLNDSPTKNKSSPIKVRGDDSSSSESSVSPFKVKRRMLKSMTTTENSSELLNQSKRSVDPKSLSKTSGLNKKLF